MSHSLDSSTPLIATLRSFFHEKIPYLSIFKGYSIPRIPLGTSLLYLRSCLLSHLVSRFYISFINWWPQIYISRIQFSSSVMSSSLKPHGLQHARPPCPSPTPSVYSNSCPLSQWCHPTISFPVIPFSSHLQSFPASGSFQMSQLFAPGGQSIGVSASASVPPMNIQELFPLGWTGWISLQSKGLSRVFSNTTVQKHQFFSTQLSL